MQASKARLNIETPHLNNPDFSLVGLDSFSHVWLSFVFHLDKHAQSSRSGIPAAGVVKSKVSPPRLQGEKRGLFATRSPHRPVPIGLSLVRLAAVEESTLIFTGVDLVDGTPILDVKPYIPTWDSPENLEDVCAKRLPEVYVPNWAQPDAIFEQGLKVTLTFRADKQLRAIAAQEHRGGKLLCSYEELLGAIGQCLAAEPRSRYRRDKCSDRLYFVDVDGIHITAWFSLADGCEVAEILRAQELDT